MCSTSSSVWSDLFFSSSSTILRPDLCPSDSPSPWPTDWDSSVCSQSSSSLRVMFTFSPNSSIVCWRSSFAISDPLLLDGPGDDLLDLGVERLQEGLAVGVLLLVVADGLDVVLREALDLALYLVD